MPLRPPENKKPSETRWAFIFYGQGTNYRAPQFKWSALSVNRPRAFPRDALRLRFRVRHDRRRHGILG